MCRIFFTTNPKYIFNLRSIFQTVIDCKTGVTEQLFSVDLKAFIECYPNTQ